MSYSYGEDDVGIDVVPTFQAINLIRPHVARVIQDMWADDEGICIAGGDFLTVFFLFKRYHTSKSIIQALWHSAWV